MTKIGTVLIFTLLASLLLVRSAHADERSFTYVYETDVLPEGEFELEQWITNQYGKQDGRYSQWNYRTEVEYGVTEKYLTSLYFNWDSTDSRRVTGVEEENDIKLKGFSWENIYQILNPNFDPVGLAGYVEYSLGPDEQELETKVLLSKPVGDWLFAFNGVYEAEWEDEGGEEGTEREATLEFDAGVAYKFCGNWSTGIEARHENAFPGGLDLKHREFSAVSVGPNIHYGSGTFWGTLTILPQVWGNGDGAEGDRNLVHEEKLETRLIIGYNF